MDIDTEIVQHLPQSLRIWQRVEVEAQRRAEERFREILKKERR